MVLLIGTWNKQFDEGGISPIAEIPYDDDLAEYLFLNDTYEIKTIARLLEKYIEVIFSKVINK